MYFLSDLLYLVVYYLVRYRRAVVRDNLARCFPEMDERERVDVERKYYHHMCDLVMEGIHNLYASPRTLRTRFRLVNRQLVDRFYEQGKSVILLTGHYGNWEYMGSSLNMQLFHQGIGIEKPLENKFMGRLIDYSRSRYGTQLVDSSDVHRRLSYFDRHHVPCALLVIGDQSPTRPEKQYWTTFLGRDTAFYHGAETFARRYDYPVVYYTVDKVRRRRYEVTFSLITDKPKEEPRFAIVEEYARRLEADIRRRPELWLWSHRRWKHQRPAAS